ncbi:MAG: helicase-related protein [Bacilli bacterium]
MGNKFKCFFCGNEDPRYIGTYNGKEYCRYCISFRGEEASGQYVKYNSGDYELNYELSKEQKVISDQLLVNFKEKKNSLVHAVCGAGKTELVFALISYCFKHKLKVGFAIPRKDVVIELEYRFKATFPTAKIVSVYGGNTSLLEGNLIILTTHQLYRYDSYFDLLIMDEIDAFPYANNSLLLEMFKKSVKGNFVLLSATPSEEYIENFKKNNGEVIELLVRFHRHPLPVPDVIIALGIVKYARFAVLLRKFIKENKPVLVFVPTIEQAKDLYFYLKWIFKKGECVYSSATNRAQIISDFKNKKYQYLITTSVLERGVTIENLQVIVFNSDHAIYNAATLIQISGRVGRKMKFPDGKVVFISKKNTKEMDEAIFKIRSANKCL